MYSWGPIIIPQIITTKTSFQYTFPDYTLLKYFSTKSIVAVPDKLRVQDREKWRKEGPRAERDKDLLKYAAPGTYVIKISDVTEPKFFDNILQPIYMKVNILKIKKSSNKYLLPKSPGPSRKAEK